MARESFWKKGEMYCRLWRQEKGGRGGMKECYFSAKLRKSFGQTAFPKTTMMTKQKSQPQRAESNCRDCFYPFSICLPVKTFFWGKKRRQILCRRKTNDVNWVPLLWIETKTIREISPLYQFTCFDQSLFLRIPLTKLIIMQLLAEKGRKRERKKRNKIMIIIIINK